LNDRIFNPAGNSNRLEGLIYRKRIFSKWEVKIPIPNAVDMMHKLSIKIVIKYIFYSDPVTLLMFQ